MKIIFESDDENLPRHIEDGHSKIFQQTLNSINEGLNFYVKQINKNKYNDYIITDHLLMLTVIIRDQVI